MLVWRHNEWYSARSLILGPELNHSGFAHLRPILPSPNYNNTLVNRISKFCVPPTASSYILWREKRLKIRTVWSTHRRFWERRYARSKSRRHVATDILKSCRPRNCRFARSRRKTAKRITKDLRLTSHFVINAVEINARQEPATAVLVGTVLKYK